MTQPVEPFATIDEQIDILASRGLTLDRAVAEQWLQSVGYYRLRGCWYPCCKPGVVSGAGRLSRSVPGASSGYGVRLYEFDRKLSTLTHDGIERVELALRSHLSYVIGANRPLANRDVTLFRPTFEHRVWITTARIRGSADRARCHSES